MGRKKKKPVKPWCWYCNREFDDDKILVQHQRAKHFKCPFCHKKLYSGPGLTVHCVQVHKETLDKIPESLPNRNSVDIDIYGMQGIPEEDVREHERLKRGDTGPPKAQEGKSQQASKSQTQPVQPVMAQHPAMMAMQAAMFQHAMGLGPMPSTFPMPPPGMVPGIAPVVPTTYLPPGFPGMPPPMMFPPGMMPSTSMSGTMAPMNQMSFPPPTQLLPTPSTSVTIPPPPPMSGVGHLIGVPPPQFPLTTTNDSKTKDYNRPSSSDQQTRSQTSNTDSTSSSSSKEHSSSVVASKPKISTTTGTISRPAATIDPIVVDSKLEPSNFIQIPNARARIMHPNKDLSLEEIKLEFRKYRVMVEKSRQSMS